MKSFLIKYQFKNGSREAWHQHMAEFVSALDSDPELKDKISYRCMREKDGSSYYHIAGASDDQAIAALQKKEFFKRYTEETERVADGKVEVLTLEVIAETTFRT